MRFFLPIFVFVVGVTASLAVGESASSFAVYPPVNFTDARASLTIVPGDYKVKNVRVGSESTEDRKDEKARASKSAVGITQTLDHYEKQIEEVIRFGKGNYKLSDKFVMEYYSTFLAEFRRVLGARGNVLPFEQFESPSLSEPKRVRDLFPDEKAKAGVIRSEMEKRAMARGIEYGIRLEVLSCTVQEDAFESYGEKFRNQKVSLTVGARVVQLKDGNVVAISVQRLEKSKKLNSLDKEIADPPIGQFLGEGAAKCALDLASQIITP